MNYVKDKSYLVDLSVSGTESLLVMFSLGDLLKITVSLWHTWSVAHFSIKKLHGLFLYISDHMPLLTLQVLTRKLLSSFEHIVSRSILLYLESVLSYFSKYETNIWFNNKYFYSIRRKEGRIHVVNNINRNAQDSGGRDSRIVTKPRA